MCSLWPYWNHGNGNPIWATCSGDQYLFPPRVTSSDCGTSTAEDLAKGCWVTALTGEKHDNYFSSEARYFFVYDKTNGITLQFYGDDDLWIFINGKLVLDLGGVHQQLPGKVVVSGDTGDAAIIEGGCLSTSGELETPTLATYTAGGCRPTGSSTPPDPASPDDFRTRKVNLGLADGKTYEVAVFHADRHPPESNYQLTLSGFTTKRSACNPRCGDGVPTAGEQCDDGDKNDDSKYGGCSTKCKWGPFCGDGKLNDGDGEECDNGKENGAKYGEGGCTIGCKKSHFCGDEILDSDQKEQCDMGKLNGKKLDTNKQATDDESGIVYCKEDCSIPEGVVY
jgi:hypothetical protein